MSESLFNKRPIIGLIVLAFALGANAQYYNSITSLPQSWMTLSLGGGVANNMSTSDFVKTRLGGGGQFEFAYEVSKKSFFFNVGVGLDYRFTSQNLDGMTDQYPRLDRDGAQILYRYVYKNYREDQHNILATVPIQFGYRCTEHFYVALGAKVSLPFHTAYKTATDMFTEGEYVQLIQPISRNVPKYGFYPEEHYSAKGSLGLTSMTVSPTVELGAWLPVAKKIECRLGVFCEYAIPVYNFASSDKGFLLDYSQVDLNPVTQTQENLADNLRFGSILTSRMNMTVLDNGGKDLLKNAPQYLTAGIRCTILFNVTQPEEICICEHY